MRKFIVSIVLLLGIIFLFGRFGEMQAIVDTRKSADFRYLFAAIFIQLIWFLNLALTLKLIFNAVNIKEKLSNLLLLVVSANFVNTITPAASMGGMAVFFSEAKRRNYPSGRVTVAAALFVLFDYIGLLCVLLLGLIVLIRRNDLTWAEILASIFFFFIAGLFAALLYVGMRSGDTLGIILAWIARKGNRITQKILKKEYVSEHRAHTFAHDIEEGLNELKHNPKSIFPPIILALVNKALLLLVLLFVFIAFDAPLSIGTLIVSLSMGYLFIIISPTPSGIGFFEGALTLMMYSMWVPLLTARDITLAFRGITLYIPLLFGMITFRLLSREIKTKNEIFASAQD